MAHWQTSTETGRILTMAIAAENTAFPTTKPNTGSSMDWTATSSGENCYGWTAKTFDLHDDDFEFEDAEGNPIVVKAPTAEKKVAIIRDEPNTPETVTFKTYEAGAKILEWLTNVSESSGVWTWDEDHATRQTLVIEVEGLGCHYFPSVEFRSGAPAGGIKTLATHTVYVDVFAGDTVTSGYQWIQYQDS